MTSNQPEILSAADVIDAIGAVPIMEALGVSRSSVKVARRHGFPSSWYPIMERLAEEAKVDLPRDVFNWRTPAAPEVAAE